MRTSDPWPWLLLVALLLALLFAGLGPHVCGPTTVVIDGQAYDQGERCYGGGW